MSPKDQLREIMPEVALFSRLSEAQLESLVRAATLNDQPRGTQLFDIDQPAERLFLVVDGTVKVYLLGADGREQILHMSGAGDLIGEAAVFSLGVFPASATATRDSVVAEFAREDILRLFRDDPEIGLAMVAGLSQRLRQFVRTIDNLALKDVSARLAGYILENEEDGACTLPGTKTELAAVLGTVREPLSRALGKLKGDGAIDEEAGRIIVLDREALEELQEGF